jgi:hypothetical protein
VRLVRLEIGHRSEYGPLVCNRENPTVLLSAGNIVPEQVPNKTPDGGKPAIACRPRIAPRGFDVIKKSEDSFGLDVIQIQFSGRTIARPHQEHEEEPERISVGANGVATDSAHVAEIVVEEALNQSQKRVTRWPQGRHGLSSRRPPRIGI